MVSARNESLSSGVTSAALLLGPEWRLRFQPQEEAATWTTFEAMQQTRLVLTAWDMTSGEAGSRSDPPP